MEEQRYSPDDGQQLSELLTRHHDFKDELHQVASTITISDELPAGQFLAIQDALELIPILTENNAHELFGLLPQTGLYNLKDSYRHVQKMLESQPVSNEVVMELEALSDSLSITYSPLFVTDAKDLAFLLENQKPHFKARNKLVREIIQSLTLGTSPEDLREAYSQNLLNPDPIIETYIHVKAKAKNLLNHYLDAIYTIAKYHGIQTIQNYSSPFNDPNLTPFPFSAIFIVVAK